MIRLKIKELLFKHESFYKTGKTKELKECFIQKSFWIVVLIKKSLSLIKKCTKHITVGLGGEKFLTMLAFL